MKYLFLLLPFMATSQDTITIDKIVLNQATIQLNETTDKEISVLQSYLKNPDLIQDKITALIEHNQERVYLAIWQHIGDDPRKYKIMPVGEYAYTYQLRE